MKSPSPSQERHAVVGRLGHAEDTIPDARRHPSVRGRAYNDAIKLHHLRALVAIVENGTFSGAALDLDTTQPTLSSAIAELERELGARLLDRGRFGAVATDVGERIVPHVRQLERSLEAIEQEVALANGDLRGHLRVTAFRSAAAHVLPTVMARLRSTHPKVQVTLHEMESRTEDVPAPSSDGGYDVAITTSLLAGEMLFWELFRDPFVVLAPQAFDEPGDEVSLDTIVAQPVIFGNSTCWSHVRGHVRAQWPELRPSFDVTEDSTMVAMVAQGLGIAVMPRLAVDALPPGVRQLELSEGLERRVGVALAPSALKVPAVRAFLMVLRDLFPQGEIPRLT